jgi:hypothetical protein
LRAVCKSCPGVTIIVAPWARVVPRSKEQRIKYRVVFMEAGKV